MKSFLLHLFLVASLFIIVTFAVIFQLERQISLNFFTDSSFRYAVLLRPIVLGILMIIGIVFGYVHSQLNTQPKNRKVNIVSEFRKAFSQGGLWRSLLSAPLVYAVIYVMSERTPDVVIASVLAFENGFFCELVLRRREHLLQQSVTLRQSKK